MIGCVPANNGGHLVTGNTELSTTIIIDVFICSHITITSTCYHIPVKNGGLLVMNILQREMHITKGVIYMPVLEFDRSKNYLQDNLHILYHY